MGLNPFWRTWRFDQQRHQRLIGTSEERFWNMVMKKRIDPYPVYIIERGNKHDFF